MVIMDFSPAGLSRYQLRREALLPRLLERTATICGLSNVSFAIGSHRKNDCCLTQDGVKISIDPSSIERIVHHNQYGTKGQLPLALADLITVLHEVNRAVDFKDPTFYFEFAKSSVFQKKARRFFNTSIDDLVIDRRLKEIHLIKRSFEAFSTRITRHDLIDRPHHIQFVNALRIMLLEDNPDITLSKEVKESLAPLTSTLETTLSILDSATCPRQSYEGRHRAADTHFYPIFLQFLKSDLNRYDSYLMDLLYEGEVFFSLLENFEPGVVVSMNESEIREYNQELFRTTDENIDKANEESCTETEDLPEDTDEGEAPGLVLPRSGDGQDDLEIAAGSTADYLQAVHHWQKSIHEMAALFLRLAAPKNSISVPRYRHIAAAEGSRLNPLALTKALIQLETGRPQGIWQPLEKRLRYQELQFNGLDIFLLFDVSCSMGGENAEYAAAMGLCLVEGLQLARHQAHLDTMQGEVDVRTQMLAFGAGWAELTPLCKTPTLTQRETTYYNLMNPSSNHTLIDGALKHVRAQALTSPERYAICLIVSDGLFSDNLASFKTVKKLPKNAYVGHISIGNAVGIPITPHIEIVYDPQVLPRKLKSILEDFFTMIDGRFAEFSFKVWDR